MEFLSWNPKEMLRAARDRYQRPLALSFAVHCFCNEFLPFFLPPSSFGTFLTFFFSFLFLFFLGVFRLSLLLLLLGFVWVLSRFPIGGHLSGWLPWQLSAPISIRSCLPQYPSWMCRSVHIDSFPILLYPRRRQRQREVRT